MKRTLVGLFAVLGLAWAGAVLAGEGTPVSEPQAGRIRAAIADFLNKETAQKGAVEVEDAKAGKTLRLSLDKVHEGVTALGDGMHRACVDMRDAAGAVYDVDVIVHAHEDEVHFVNKVLHKAGGEDRLKAEGKYKCPMCKITSDKPGRCPKCGMNMEPVEKTRTDEHAH